MLNKSPQQKKRYKITYSNILPILRSRQFILNYVRRARQIKPSGALRAAVGLIRWTIMKKQAKGDYIAHRSSCFVSARSRGVYQRFGIARTKIKELSGQGRLFGLRKSSW